MPMPQAKKCVSEFGRSAKFGGSKNIMADQDLSGTPTSAPLGAVDDAEERLKADIAKRLRWAVERAGGPGVVSAKSGVVLRTLGNYTSGKNDVKATALVRLAEVCGVSVEWLATGQESAEEEAKSDFSSYERLIAINAALDEEEAPISAERLREKPELASLRGELEELAKRTDLADNLRGYADLMLRLAFGDGRAAERHRMREERLHARFREANANYREAIEVMEWEPPRVFGQALRSLCFNYGLSVEDVISMLDALKCDIGKEG